MLRKELLLGSVLVGVLLAGGLLFGEQQPSQKGKGKLPLYWNKIGLSDEQRKKVSAIMGEYKVKIDALKTEISKLEEEEKREMSKVLTDAQKEELRKIISGKALGEPTAGDKSPKSDKKPGDK
jgi:hypothetical protein